MREKKANTNELNDIVNIKKTQYDLRENINICLRIHVHTHTFICQA